MTTFNLPGTPSDDAERVLALGGSVADLVYVSMSARHPEGRDVDYLRWHFFDHRPEQYRLEAIRGSLRLVSTPECRAARAASDERFDATDHVMNYFFSDPSGLEPFHDLGRELGKVGRIPELLPAVERGVYAFDGRAAAPDAKVGADVLPWWPADRRVPPDRARDRVGRAVGRRRGRRRRVVGSDRIRRAGAVLARAAGRSAHLPVPRRRPGGGRRPRCDRCSSSGGPTPASPGCSRRRSTSPTPTTSPGTCPERGSPRPGVPR